MPDPKTHAQEVAEHLKAASEVKLSDPKPGANVVQHENKQKLMQSIDGLINKALSTNNKSKGSDDVLLARSLKQLKMSVADNPFNEAELLNKFNTTYRCVGLVLDGTTDLKTQIACVDALQTVAQDVHSFVPVPETGVPDQIARLKQLHKNLVTQSGQNSNNPDDQKNNGMKLK